jgi:hypothetical protein
MIGEVNSFRTNGRLMMRLRKQHNILEIAIQGEKLSGDEEYYPGCDTI